jgi:hypothetical protein
MILFFIALYANSLFFGFVIFGETFLLQEQTKGDDESSRFFLQKYENLGELQTEKIRFNQSKL